MAKDLYWRIARVQTLLRAPRGEAEAAREGRLKEAATLIDEVERQAPKQRYGFLLEGQLHEARAAAAKARDKDGYHAEVRAAIKAYERAMDFDGGQVGLQRLVVLYSREHDDEGLERLSRSRPDLAGAQDRIAAEVALAQGEGDRAKKIAARVAGADPDSLDVRVWQARILTMAGDEKGAEAVLRDLARRKPAELGPWSALLAWQVQRARPRAEMAETVDQIRGRVKSDQPELLWAECYRRIGDLPHALEAYEAALAKWPVDPAVARLAVEFFETTGRVDRAEAAVRGVLRRDPKQRWAARTLALILSERGRQDPAARDEARSLMGTPGGPGDGPEERLIRAVVLARSPDLNNRRAAAEQLERLAADLPRDVAASTLSRRILGELYLESGQVAKARAQAEVDAQDANNTQAILNYAVTLNRDGLWDEADRQVGRLEALDPSLLDVVRLRSRVLAGKGKVPEAVALLEKYFADRRETPAAQAVGLVVVSGLLDLGAGGLGAADRLAAELARRWPVTAWRLAAIRAQQGQHVEAFRLAGQAAAAGSPEAVDRAVSMAVADGSAEQINLAMGVLDAALKLKPNNADLLVKKGFLAHFLHDYEAEIRYYEQALAQDPADLRFLNNMAWTLSEDLGRYKEALQRLDEVFNKTSIYPQFRDTRGVVLTRLGQVDEAIRELELAASLSRGQPSFATIQFHLARAYDLAGKKEEARAAMIRARDARINLKLLEPKEKAEYEDLSAKLVASRS